MKKLLLVYLLCLMLSSLILSRSAAKAVSTSVIFEQLQTGGMGSGTASEEAVVIRNVSLAPVDVSGWCLQYSSAANGSDFTMLSCVTASLSLKLMLDTGGQMSFATDQFVLKNPSFHPDYIFSAGLASGGGHVRLTDSAGIEIDRLGWGTAIRAEGVPATPHVAGEVLGRNDTHRVDTDNNATDFTSMAFSPVLASGLYEVEVPKDVCPNIDGLQMSVPESYLIGEDGSCMQDVCINIEGSQASIPEDYSEAQEAGVCYPIVLESRPLLITEILPNAPSYDDGLEFIEIYNPNETTVNLQGYRIDLGLGSNEGYTFYDGQLMPGQYKTISDTTSGIVLPNTSGVVRLLAPAGNVVSETEAYSEPEDGISWAFLEEGWAFSNQPTPGEANKPSVEIVPEGSSVTLPAVLPPCPSGKVRNPETNRCRAVVLDVAMPSCPTNQYRNPTTNRCKSVVVENVLAACKEGQERNPETNRCKSVAGSTKSLIPCEEGEERNPQTNRCKKAASSNSGQSLAGVKDVFVESTGTPLNILLVAALLFCALVYVGYEWRHEIMRKILQRKARTTAYAR